MGSAGESCADVYDVVIVGAGVSGLTAAALLGQQARENPQKKLRIALLESQRKLGGILSGALRIPGVFVPGSVDDVRSLDADADAERLQEHELNAFVRDGQSVVSQLVRMNALHGLFKSESPSYIGSITKNTQFHDNTSDRSCTGMFWRILGAFLYFFIAAIFPGTAAIAPRIPGSKRLPLPGIVHSLSSFVQALDPAVLHIRRGCACTDLQREERGTLWEVHTSTNEVVLAKNVIFASGGFAANAKILQRRGLSGVVAHFWNEHNSGIIEEVAERLRLRASSQALPRAAWWCEAVSIAEHAPNQAVLFLNGGSMMVVNRTGRRMYNEKQEYARRGRVCFANRGLVLITDGENLNKHIGGVAGPDNIHIPARSYTNAFVRARSAEELAAALIDKGVAEPAFAGEFPRQLQQFNDMANNGVDAEFGRGRNTARETSFQDPSAPLLSAIDDTDLYACELLPSALDTCSGPALDERNRCIDGGSGEAVPGLFAIGNCAASITNGVYLAPGIPMISGMIGALRATNAILGSETVTPNYFKKCISSLR